VNAKSSDKLTVGIIAPPWPIPAHGYGGLEAVVDVLCRGLESLGHDVRLWASTDSTCPVPTSGVVGGADFARRWPMPLEIYHVLAGYDWMAEQRVSIIHDHSLLGPLVGAASSSVPVVTTCHLPLASQEVERLYRNVSHGVDVIAISHAQAGEAERIRIAGVIHHGTDVAASPLGQAEGDEGGPYVAFLGRMSPEKGVREAIVATQEVGLRLKIAARIGNSSERNYFEKYVKPLLGKSAIYVGELDRPAKLDFLGRASALVNPVSWPEPFGLVMIEALACGTPVFALRSGAVPEILDDGVTGAVCGTLHELTSRLRHIDEYDRGACRFAAESRFSMGRMASEHATFYVSSMYRARRALE
jgi:glycosyltransferase involved in cell wall biosynthesis